MIRLADADDRKKICDYYFKKADVSPYIYYNTLNSCLIKNDEETKIYCSKTTTQEFSIILSQYAHSAQIWVETGFNFKQLVEFI